ncbi:MAG: rhomboid family intramembrane serine protease [Bacillota bacterium]
MIPLRDSIRSHRFPYVNVALIVLNMAVFVYQSTLTREQLVEVFRTFGLIPLAFTAGPVIPAGTLVTSVFLHGSLLHLGGNMLYLWVFGDNIEDRVGHLRYLLFYLAGAVAAAAAHIVANPASRIPTIGASGAVAAVLGAYLLKFPRSRVLALVPIFFFVTIARLPAILFLGLWFVLQVLNAGAAQGAQLVAWWAHIGGFVAGVLLIMLFPAQIHNRGDRIG